jgi:hypothetical protein
MEVKLAGWASSLLASSMVLAIAILFVILGLSEIPAWAREKPIAVVVFAMFFAGYIISFVCLHKVRKTGGSGALPLWIVSLIGACAPLVGLAYWLESGAAALAIGVVELAAVLLHLVAIGMIVMRRQAA